MGLLQMIFGSGCQREIDRMRWRRDKALGQAAQSSEYLYKAALDYVDKNAATVDTLTGLLDKLEERHNAKTHPE